MVGKGIALGWSPELKSAVGENRFRLDTCWILDSSLFDCTTTFRAYFGRIAFIVQGLIAATNGAREPLRS